jgi:tetratricopeptide (TPR) repeat protein
MPAKTLFCIVFSLLLITTNASAQSVKDAPIQIKNFRVAIQANNLTAITTATIEFYNPNNKVLDGEYNFSLQQQQQVTGFYLDINGNLREGVMVTKQIARVAYENTIRRRIDPGVLEMTTGNNYRVRIYPMPAKGVRKIKIIISELLQAVGNNLQYHLPLNDSNIIENFAVNIKVNNAVNLPTVIDGMLLGNKFEGNNLYHLSVIQNNIALNKPISFLMPVPTTTQFYKSDCNNNFMLRLQTPTPNNVVLPINKVTMFWDVSSSATNRDIEKELQYLKKFIDERNVQQLQIVTFNNNITKPVTVSVRNNFNALKSYLQRQVYDGGTQLGSINLHQHNADAFLLFSDGVHNFGKENLQQNGKQIFCVSSSAKANYTLLQQIAVQSRGACINLTNTTLKHAAIASQYTNACVATIQQGAKTIEALQFQNQKNDQITVFGNLTNTTDTLQVKIWQQGNVVMQYSINAATLLPIEDGLLQKVEMLLTYDSLITNTAAQKTVAQFATQQHIVSANSSFIVLDNLNDYIEYGIQPPAELQPEYEKNMFVIKKLLENETAKQRNEAINNLRSAANLYNERISWYGQNETAIRISDIDMQFELMAIKQAEAAAANTTTATANTNFNTKVSNLEEVVVVGYGTQRRRSMTGASVTISGQNIFSGAQTLGQALQGRVAGLQVVSNAVIPGAAEKIIIRGTSSFMGQEPLYVLDGVPIDASVVSTLNVSEIQNVTVLRGIQASSLYGSRASNGAIIINMRNGNNQNINKGITRYKDLDDVDYVHELTEAGKENIYAKYLTIRDKYKTELSFYIDAAQILFDNNDTAKALTVLSNLAEMNNESHQLLRAMGYVLEQWNMYDKAIDVYAKVLAIKEEEPQSYRDLALAYHKNGQHQLAVNLLYTVLIKNFNQYEERYRGLKSLLLNEMNTIIAQHRSQVDISNINQAIIKPLPVDMRIVIDWNKDETDIDLHVVEPGGEECFYDYRVTKNGGRLSEDFTQGYGPEEYQIKNAKKGKYSIRVNYFGDRYQKQQVPSAIKITIYKNFGRPNQTVTTQNLIMDHQQGIVEIATVKF